MTGRSHIEVGCEASSKNGVLQIIRSLVPPGTAVAGGPIIVESELFPTEQSLINRAAHKRQMEFAAGRTYARQALKILGHGSFGPILIGPGGQPVWPRGIAGSITHSDELCCAIAAVRGDIISLGVDIEIARPIEDGLVEMICTGNELAAFRALPVIAGIDWVNLAFSAKEAFYKSQYSVTKQWLGFHDVTVFFFPFSRMHQGIYTVTLGTARRSIQVSFLGRWAYCDGYVFATAILQRPSQLDPLRNNLFLSLGS